MKYEYLCGYESDFFAMPANVIAVVRLDHCVQGLTEFSQIIECGKPVLAMRRIIKEPKRWTVEDQKAGRLPEVGVKVALNLSDEVVKSSAIQSWKNGDELEVLRTFKKDEPNGEYASALFNLRTKTCGLVLTKYLSPIETEAEKSQREEDEFVEELASGASRYDSFINGARAAYRKLKGGE